MNLDVLVLALGSAPRPAGIAALYALLSASSPRRVLVAYIAAGFTFSVAVGVLVVAIFHGAGIDYRGTDWYSVIELLGGVAALICRRCRDRARPAARARRGRRRGVGDHPKASQPVGDHCVGRGYRHSPPRTLLPDRPTG